jgi:guanosine-diphosphatase
LDGHVDDYDPLAAHSLKALSGSEVAVIPSAQHRCTPLMVKATAGLRLLSPTKAAEILRAVEHYLSEAWPFLLPRSFDMDGPVTILDGRDEALFASITVNYLLQRFTVPVKDRATAGIMDLGGGSTQVSFDGRFDNILMRVCRV